MTVGTWPVCVYALQLGDGGSSREEGASRMWPSKDQQESLEEQVEGQEEATNGRRWTG